MSADTKDLKPKVQRMMNQFLSVSKQAGIGLLVTQGFRSVAEQNYIYAQGRTRPGKIVTNAKGGQSFHNFGLAFDVCGWDGKTVHYDIDWNKLELLAKAIGLEHGDRGYKDLPHFQFRNGHSLEDIQKGRYKPTEFS